MWNSLCVTLYANVFQVMMKYLDKIKVMAETATNGQECTEMVFSKEPGYYSLIIVSERHRSKRTQ